MSRSSQELRYGSHKVFIINHATILYNQGYSNINKYTIWHFCNIFLFQKLPELLVNYFALIASTYREVMSATSEMQLPVGGREEVRNNACPRVNKKCLQWSLLPKKVMTTLEVGLVI